jgi:hypothetical protein
MGRNVSLPRTFAVSGPSVKNPKSADFFLANASGDLAPQTPLTLLLNTLLAGRTNVQPCRGAHFWACFEGKTQRVQNFYSVRMGECVLDAPSPLTDRLEEINANEYFTVVRGLDGGGLRVPSDLDLAVPAAPAGASGGVQSRRLLARHGIASVDVSMSASFGALVSAIKSLINTRGPGSAARFREFLERYAPGASLVSRRNEMYDLRSGIFHGSELMSIDEDITFGWDPPWLNERELHEELWTVTRIAMRNWLRNP